MILYTGELVRLAEVSACTGILLSSKKLIKSSPCLFDTVRIAISLYFQPFSIHFLILSSAHMAPGKTPLNPHKPINL